MLLIQLQGMVIESTNDIDVNLNDIDVIFATQRNFCGKNLS
jgi:hypothetical protein